MTPARITGERFMLAGYVERQRRRHAEYDAAWDAAGGAPLGTASRNRAAYGSPRGKDARVRPPPRAESRKEGKTMLDYLTHPDTAEAQVIWGYRQRDADAALGHFEAAAASLLDAENFVAVQRMVAH